MLTNNKLTRCISLFLIETLINPCVFLLFFLPCDQVGKTCFR